MIPLKDCDPLTMPLDGTILIEASAGTGKTYTISALVLRLILEKGITIDRILVVTFTKAATEELKDRIRRKLRQCIDAFKLGRHEDRFLNSLVSRYAGAEKALKSLGEALRDFDEAAIFTIHGFCQRILSENAFETGFPFDTDLVTDEDKLRQEIVYDFWRRHFYRADPEFASYLLSTGLSPASFLNGLKSALVHHELKIIPDIEIVDLESLELFRKEFDTLRQAWPRSRDAVWEKLMDDGLNGRLYGTKTPLPEGHSKRDRVVSDLLANMDRVVSSEYAVFPLSNNLKKLTSRTLASSIKKGLTPPDHEIFHICETVADRAQALETQMDRRILALRTKMLRLAKEKLKARKQERNIRSFDDLLMDTKTALKNEAGVLFAGQIRAKYDAALIDEFQDTDPIQNAIFQTLFGTDGGVIFLIGDPKQAIYGFRGADLFTYMKAAGQVRDRLTLRKNWRSEPGLIASVNSIFSRRTRPFLYEEILYPPAVPGDNAVRQYLTFNGKKEPPLHLWILETGAERDPDKPIAKTKARELIPQAVAAEILTLVSMGRKKRAFIGDTPLKESHIAVLVRKNLEARLIQKNLARHKIPSVLYSSGNLFDSIEALEAERILCAVAEPDNEALLRVALVTDILGTSGEELEQSMNDGDKWESIAYRFRHYHELWNSKGFLPMFRFLISKEKARHRLLTFPDGERRLTNLLHLAEVLHRESFDKNMRPTTLLKWLSDQRNPASPRLEEHQLRLESDEEAVEIVTIHKSKGLEFPIVFCPFMWDGSEIRGDEFVFHDEHRDLQLTLDLGSAENSAHKALAEQEALAENLRLLYVALTRAKNRCYLVWGRINGAETSALAYILHGPQSYESGKVVEATGSFFQKLDDRTLIKEIKGLVDEAKGTVRLSGLPDERPEDAVPSFEDAGTLSARTISVIIPRDWKVSSFSSLVSGGQVFTEIPDHDTFSAAFQEAEGPVESINEGDVPTGIFAFPRGARPGTFLHDVLEHLDFAIQDTAPMKDLVAGKLDEYGLESLWLGTICDLILRVLSIPLDPQSEGLRLSCIQNKDRLNELEFYFPLKSVSPEKLERLFHIGRGHPPMEDLPKTMGRLQFAPTRGFMKGFIDLVFQWGGRFYLVDWKSNFLGSRVEDYGQDSLISVMKQDCYFLQYFIYTLALDQYLKLRMPEYRYEEHFGGVFYIFLRGVDLEKGPDFGIYRDLPSPAWVEELSKQLIPEIPLPAVNP
jgi:exodeoxyribonuclease V beta subunit